MLIILLNVILSLNIFAKSIYAVVEANENQIYVGENEESEVVNNKISNSKVVNNEKSNNNKEDNGSKTSQSNNRKEQNKLNNIDETKRQIKKENEKENNQTPEIYIENNGANVVNTGQDTENDISIRNTGNTNFEKLIWEYEVPTKYLKLKKFNTGTYNQNIRYNVLYKTNLSENYRLILEGISSNENFEIDLEGESANGEYVTGIKAEFNKIDDGFCSNENPHFVSKVLQDITSESKFVSTAVVKGTLTNHEITDESKCETFVYKSLPKTGF